MLRININWKIYLNRIFIFFFISFLSVYILVLEKNESKMLCHAFHQFKWFQIRLDRTVQFHFFLFRCEMFVKADNISVLIKFTQEGQLLNVRGLG